MNTFLARMNWLLWGTRPKIVIFNIRHGNSITNEKRMLHKHASDPAVWLTELGHQQAQKAGQFLVDYFRTMPASERPKKIRIFRSFYRRARQTAEHIEQAFLNAPDLGISITVKEHARLRELEFGYAGSSQVEKLLPFVRIHQMMLRFQGYKYLATRFGGESPATVEPRARLSLDAAHRDALENGVEYFFFVNHGLTSRVIDMAAMSYSVEWYQNQPNPDNCAIRLLERGVDKGYIFPNPNGQWDPNWVPEEPEVGDPKLNPGGRFFSPEEMDMLIEVQKQRPNVVFEIGALLENDQSITATAAIAQVLGTATPQQLSA